MESPVEKALLALEAELGVKLTVHDLEGVFHDAGGNPLLAPGRQTHRWNPLCLNIDRERCVAHCMMKVNALTSECSEDFLLERCPFGLVEMILPVRRGRLHLATISAGVWRPEGAEDAPACFAKSKSLSESYRKLGVLDAVRAERLGAILSSFGRGLVSLVESLQKIEEEPGSRKEEIFRFVAMNASSQISTCDLAEKLHLSSSRAGHLVSELFGVSFAELVLQERMKRAKALLRSTDFRMGEIAAKTGFGSECHFSRAFRKAAGMTPGECRRLKA